MELKPFLLIVSILLTVITGLLIPLFVRIIRTMKSIEDLADTTRKSVQPLLEDLDETVGKVNGIVESVEGAVDNIKAVTEPVGELGLELSRALRTLKESEMYVTNIRANVQALRSALRASLHSLATGLFRKKES